jgi:hypothetical protein
MWPGQGMSFKVDEVLFTGRSDFQVSRDRASATGHAGMQNVTGTSLRVIKCIDYGSIYYLILSIINGYAGRSSGENGSFWDRSRS